MKIRITHIGHTICVEKERWRLSNLSDYIVRHITTLGRGENYGNIFRG